nr:3-hydroxyacyl-CoA dehydrogenase NAD-binding domain-containing protein [Microbispora cellulosiformans]
MNDSGSNIGVVGAGTMGVGVAHLFAENGFDVTLHDISAPAIERARELIERNARFYCLIRPDEKPVSPEEILSRITFTTDLESFKDTGFVVENATESFDVKRPIYEALDGICPDDCIFAVNTSAISITRLAGLTGRPGNVVGVHFMNPAPLKPLVEVVRGVHTTAETLEATRGLIARLGKDSLVVNDSPGFVTNRVLMLTINEAIFLLSEDVARPDEIDRLFKECFGHKMGPLQTADLIGLDTVLLSLEVLYESFNDSKYRPSPLLRKMVYAGLLGEKSGRGFHNYA